MSFFLFHHMMRLEKDKHIIKDIDYFLIAEGLRDMDKEYDQSFKYLPVEPYANIVALRPWMTPATVEDILLL